MSPKARLLLLTLALTSLFATAQTKMTDEEIRQSVHSRIEKYNQKYAGMPFGEFSGRGEDGSRLTRI